MMRNRLVEQLDNNAIDESKTTAMTTYRASEKTATMIELMSIILKKPVASLFTISISEKIADNILKDDRNIDVLKEFLSTDFNLSGAINILFTHGIIEENLILDVSSLDSSISLTLDKVN